MTRSRIRVAYILTPITFGGAEKVSLNFLRTVDRKIFDIMPILLVRPWEDKSYFVHELGRLGYDYETVPVALNKNRDPLRVPRVAYRLHSLLKKGLYDIVHTHGYFADICGQVAASMLGIRGISTCHGFIDVDWKMRLYIRLDKYALRLCEKVIAVSEMIKTELIKSCSKTKIVVIPNGVSPSCDENEFNSRRREKRSMLSIAPDDHVIGYLGRLSAEKGLSNLIEAIAALHSEGTRLKLVIIGEGPERVALEHQVEARGLTSKVIFAGFQTDPENWYPAFDIFALPSLTEGTPLALLESMAAGVPIIASAVGGVPKIVADGINGLLVSPGSPLEIMEKILLLNDDKDMSLRLGKAGKETIKAEFSIDVWCRRIENCYTEVFRLSRLSTVKKAISRKLEF